MQGLGLIVSDGRRPAHRWDHRQPLASPAASDLIRGTFALASTQLTFTKGTVSFDGAGLLH